MKSRNALKGEIKKKKQTKWEQQLKNENMKKAFNKEQNPKVAKKNTHVMDEHEDNCGANSDE